MNKFLQIFIILLFLILINSCSQGLKPSTKKWLEEQSKIYKFDKNDINSSNANGIAAIHIAALNGREDIIEDLVLAGANVNDRDLIKGETPLFYGIQDKRVVEKLIELEADINIIDFNGMTPLHKASKKSNIEIIEMLLSAGVDVNVYDEKNNSPLYYAMFDSENLDIVLKLIEAGADVNIGISFGESPLHVAINNENIDLFKILIEAGHNINIYNEDGEMPIHTAIIAKKPYYVNCLIQAGANVNSVIKDGFLENYSVLDLLINYEMFEIIDIIIKYDLYLNKRLKVDIFGDAKTPLYYFIYNEYFDIALRFIRAGADVDSLNSYAMIKEITELYLASSKGYNEIVSELIKAGSDVDFQDNYEGYTSLHLSVMHEHYEVCKILLEAGADPNIVTENYFSLKPFDYVYRPENDEEEKIKDLLIEYGATR